MFIQQIQYLFFANQLEDTCTMYSQTHVTCLGIGITIYNTFITIYNIL